MSKPTDPRFNEPLPGDRSPSAATYRFDKEHAKAVQTALFEHIKVRTDRGPRRMTRLDAVIRQLNQDCLQGNPSAIREQDKLVALLREKNDLAPADPDSDRAKFHKRIKDDKQRREDHIPFFSICYTLAKLDLTFFYMTIHLQEPPFEFKVPYFVDPEPGQAELAKVRKTRQRKEVDPNVGYKSPPVSTRYQSGQSGNSSGKSKQQPMDGWDVLRAGLMQSVVVRKGQKTSKLPSAAVTCTRVVERAIAGEKAARRKVREYIAELDRWGMMEAPPKKQRRKKRSSIEEFCFNKMCLAERDYMAIQLWKEMWDDVVRVFGDCANQVYDDLFEQAESEYKKYFNVCFAISLVNDPATRSRV